MFTMMIFEKLIGLAVILAAVTVGVATLMHGDFSLGLLVLFGQLQSFITGHGHGPVSEATHVIAHKH